MGVINRTLEPSQKRDFISFQRFVALTSGETGVLCHVPFPCHISAFQIAAFSVQADVNLRFTVNRFIPGTGFTNFSLGSTFVPYDYGVSGVLVSGVSLPASASSLMLLVPNDVVGYIVGGGVTASINGLSGCFVIRPLQDEKRYLGGLV